MLIQFIDQLTTKSRRAKAKRNRIKLCRRQCAAYWGTNQVAHPADGQPSSAYDMIRGRA